MATITSTATGKKKLVYKQDPDGVFRLKKLPSDASSTLSRGSEDVLLEKRAVDNYINELIGCSYEVPAPKPPLTPVPEKVVVDESKKLPDSDDKQPSRGKKPRKAKTPSPRSLSPDNGLLVEIDHPEPVETPLPLSVDPAPFADPESEAEDDIMPAPKSRFAVDPVTLPADPRIVSYVLGLATAGLLLRFWPLVSSYAVVFFNVLKMGLLWGTVVAAIAWYAGLINVQNLLVVFLKGLVDRLRGRILGLALAAPKPASPAKSATLAPKPLIHPRPLQTLPDSSSEEEEEEDDEVVTIPEEPRRARSASPQKERRNTLTRVTPYKPAPKPDRYHSVQDLPRHTPTPKLNRIQTADARLYQRRLAPLAASSRKNSAHSLDTTYLRSHDVAELPSRLLPHKRLPPNPYEAEELPFINEVKLMTKAEMDDDSIVDVHRLGSVFSKKSVLGTRAGYNKFLENFGDD